MKSYKTQEDNRFVGSKMESNSIHCPTNETSDFASSLCNFRFISSSFSDNYLQRRRTVYF